MQHREYALRVFAARFSYFFSTTILACTLLSNNISTEKKEGSKPDGLLPKSLFTLSKTFLIPAVGGIPGALTTRPAGPAASGIQSAYLPLRQD